MDRLYLIDSDTFFNPYECSCGCNHVRSVAVNDAEWTLEFTECRCPNYRLHTAYQKVIPDWFINNRWRGEAEYYSYISSRDWEEKRNNRREELGNRCTVCATTINLQVHHNTYVRLGNELPVDLTVLCGKHHEIFTKHGNMPKQTGFRKGRHFIDKTHSAENNSLLLTAYICLIEKAAWLYFQDIEDDEEQAKKVYELLMSDIWTKAIDDYIDIYGQAMFISLLPRVTFKT